VAFPEDLLQTQNTSQEIKGKNRIIKALSCMVSFLLIIIYYLDVMLSEHALLKC
jgi:hypothetical protein